MKIYSLRAFYSFIPPFLIVLLLWLVFLLSEGLGWDLSFLGVYPRSLKGLAGIVGQFFVHADYSHILSNSLPLLLLGWALFYFYPEIAYKVYLCLLLGSGMLTWLIAYPAWHIGASGVVYGLVFFIFFSGLIRRHATLVALSLVVVLLYGSMVWTMLPISYFFAPNVSWQGHLSGAICGVILAIYYRHIGLQQPQIIDEEDELCSTEDDEPPYWEQNPEEPPQ